MSAATRTSASRTLALCASVVIVVLSTGCERFVAGHEAKDHAFNASATVASGCASSGYPLLTLRTRLDEPSMAIPKPPGWTPVRFGKAGAPLRIFMVNKDLRDTSAKFTPRAVVGLDDYTGRAHTPEEALDQELRDIGLTFLSKTPGVLCGHPSITVLHEYRDEPRTLVKMRAVAGEFGKRMYVAIVSTMSTQPYNETYLAGQQAILDGFAVLFAGKY